MPSLFELQRDFAAGLNAEHNNILQYIDARHALSAKEHFAIYQSSVRAALQKALADIYPVCMKLVGEEFFIALANEFIYTTPSKQPNIGEYGATLADFIATFKPAATVPYLADTARLEWAWHTAFHAADSPLLDFQALANASETHGEQLIFSLPKGAVLLTSPYPIHHIWQMNQEEAEQDEPLILLENQRYFLFIWRKGLEMRIDLPTETEWVILHWIQQKQTLSQVCLALETRFPNTAMTDILPQFAARGWLTGFIF